MVEPPVLKPGAPPSSVRFVTMGMRNDVRGNQWFGEPWPSVELRAGACADDRFRIPTPVGGVCMHCGEEITDKDRGFAYPGAITAGPNGDAVFDPTPLYAHLECQLRNVLGCSAGLHGEPHDHSGSYREDARRVQTWVDAGGLDRG